jgi:hypothetical protein
LIPESRYRSANERTGSEVDWLEVLLLNLQDQPRRDSLFRPYTRYLIPESRYRSANERTGSEVDWLEDLRAQLVTQAVDIHPLQCSCGAQNFAVMKASAARDLAGLPARILVVILRPEPN